MVETLSNLDILEEQVVEEEVVIAGLVMMKSRVLLELLSSGRRLRSRIQPRDHLSSLRIPCEVLPDVTTSWSQTFPLD